jgi:hypothetical protein
VSPCLGGQSLDALALTPKYDFDLKSLNSPESMTTNLMHRVTFTSKFEIDQENKTMKKTILTFGLISGGIMAVMMFATLPFTDSAWLQSHSMFIGYTTMVLSFMLVFFGIRSYRENIGGGTITFGRAFAVGILITLISSVLYVVTWEIMYFGVPSFGERFMTMCVAHIKNSGASPEAIQTQLNQLKYLDNPFINAAMTFAEPFPVGLIITLISAAILRKKTKALSDGSPATVEA